VEYKVHPSSTCIFLLSQGGGEYRWRRENISMNCILERIDRNLNLLIILGILLNKRGGFLVSEKT